MQKEKDMEMLIAYRNSNLGGQKGSKIGIQSRNPTKIGIYKKFIIQHYLSRIRISSTSSNSIFKNI